MSDDAMQCLQAGVAEEKDAELYVMMQQVANEMEAYSATDYLMTDDKAPVELLGMQVIDELIQDEVSYYKAIYEQDGIRGLLDVAGLG